MCNDITLPATRLSHPKLDLADRRDDPIRSISPSRSERQRCKEKGAANEYETDRMLEHPFQPQNAELLRHPDIAEFASIQYYNTRQFDDTLWGGEGG